MKHFIQKVMTVVLLLAPLSAPISTASAAVRVVNVYDGDTVTLSDGTRVRLVQIDAPEVQGQECYSTKSRETLVSLLKAKNITFVSDPKLDTVDKYGRRLGYLFAGKTNINLRMVELGAATPYFYRGAKGEYANAFMRGVKSAQKNALGLWKECPGTQLNVYSAVATLGEISSSSTTTCDPNYSGCVPLTKEDLDCPDIRTLGIAPVKILGVDIHRLDHDKDGYGCE